LNGIDYLRECCSKKKETGKEAKRRGKNREVETAVKGAEYAPPLQGFRRW
jgi:hypothetical protein